MEQVRQTRPGRSVAFESVGAASELRFVRLSSPRFWLCMDGSGQGFPCAALESLHRLFCS